MQAKVVKELMNTPHYREMMQPLDYSALFRNRGVRIMVPSVHQFLWTVYYDVRAHMMQELAAFSAPHATPAAEPYAIRDAAPGVGKCSKKEMVAWLTAPSEEKGADRGGV